MVMVTMVKDIINIHDKLYAIPSHYSEFVKNVQNGQVGALTHLLAHQINKCKMEIVDKNGDVKVMYVHHLLQWEVVVAILRI